ncbi:MAG TPA: redoxin domain-containing protein [Deltaproteobacteria bacterium]|jgi:cytochrome oxidase Cu insertion factor (SCO1/SenC/PrrC family)|nr:redoxin domain-containing protein [Deltaproteobacteria bacterium]HOI07792.1 redoxin domain-containing protein [Deltaproteobacteria bacterium]
MEHNDVNQMFQSRLDRLGLEEYNYEHFTRDAALRDVRATVAKRGIGPGCPAPDFELEDTEGGRVRLSDLKGRPVLLRFGSIT